MKIAICDDEKEMRSLLGEKIHNIFSMAELSYYPSGEEFLADYDDKDLLFLDIQMPGRNGMDIARELRKTNQKVIIIFVTAIKEYVFQAFDVGAFHYLVKPFDDGELERILRNAIEQYQLSKQIQETCEEEERYVMVHSKGTHIKVLLKNIVYAEVLNRKVTIYERNRKIEYYGKLSALEKSAGDNFFRTHRAYLVHFKYIEKYDISTIYLEKGTALIAKQNYTEFVKRYLSYNHRKE